MKNKNAMVTMFGTTFRVLCELSLLYWWNVLHCITNEIQSTKTMLTHYVHIYIVPKKMWEPLCDLSLKVGGSRQGCLWGWWVSNEICFQVVENPCSVFNHFFTTTPYNMQFHHLFLVHNSPIFVAVCFMGIKVESGSKELVLQTCGCTT